MDLQQDSLVGDNPHYLQHECASLSLLGTHFLLPILDMFLQFFMDSLDHGSTLGGLFLKVSFCLPTYLGKRW